MASQNGHVATCALLIERGATVDYQNKVKLLPGLIIMYTRPVHVHIIPVCKYVVTCCCMAIRADFTHACSDTRTC